MTCHDSSTCRDKMKYQLGSELDVFLMDLSFFFFLRSFFLFSASPWDFAFVGLGTSLIAYVLTTIVGSFSFAWIFCWILCLLRIYSSTKTKKLLMNIFFKTSKRAYFTLTFRINSPLTIIVYWMQLRLTVIFLQDTLNSLMWIAHIH